MQVQGDFTLCANSTDVIKNFAVIKSVAIKRVYFEPCHHKTCLRGFRPGKAQTACAATEAS